MSREGYHERPLSEGFSADDDISRIVSISQDPIVGIDRAGCITVWNHGAEALLGWTADEVRERPAMELLPTEHDHGAYQEILEQHVFGSSGHFTEQLDVVARHKDGTRIPAQVVLTALRTTRQTVACAIVRSRNERIRISNENLDARVCHMADHAVVMLWLSDSDKTWTWVNRSWQIFFGRTTAPRHAWIEHVHPDDRQACFAAYVHAFERREPFSMEYRAMRHDGVWRRVVHDGAPLYSSGQHFLGFGGSCADVTELRQSTDLAAESQLRYRTLAESLPHLVWTCLPNGWCDYLSRQWVEYTGIPEQQQLGYAWADQLHPDDRERVQAEWTAATARGDRFDIEFRIRRKDGVYRWFKTRAVPLRDHQDHIIKWFGSNTDFEEYKVAERRLRIQLERLSLLDRITRAIGARQDLHSMFEVVLTSLQENLSVEFCCICLGDHTAPALAVAAVRSSPPGRLFSTSFGERASVAVDPNGLASCLTGKLVYEPRTGTVPFPFPQRLAAAGLESLVLAPLLVESRVFGVLVAAREAADAFSSADCEFLRQLSEHVALATNQAELYQTLHRAYEDLRQSREVALQHERLRALGEMAAGIAHNINNAISPVSIYAEALLESETLTPEARDYLETIRRAIGDVAFTVSGMREFYRPQKPEVTVAKVNLNEVVQHATDLTRARWSDIAQRSGITIRVVLDLDPGSPSLWGVAPEVREAVVNLIFNAVDAMPEGGTLKLRTHLSRAPGDLHERSWIAVTDEGVGMDEELRAKCLEPFVTTKGERGTGLGLALVYGVVQRHEGSIDISSTPGVGTTVSLSFRSASDGNTAHAGAARAHLPVRSLRLLLIDDDALVLKVMRDTLTRDGHAVTTAGSGARGIEAFTAALESQSPFDAVITDLGMPDIDGRQVAKAVKGAAPMTPVVLLTGWGRRLSPDEAATPHVDEVLGKPPRLGELREALARLCPDSDRTS